MIAETAEIAERRGMKLRSTRAAGVAGPHGEACEYQTKNAFSLGASFVWVFARLAIAASRRRVERLPRSRRSNAVQQPIVFVTTTPLLRALRGSNACRAPPSVAVFSVVGLIVTGRFVG